MYWASTSCAQRIYYPHTSLLQTRYISWLGYQLRRAYGFGFPKRVLLLDFRWDEKADPPRSNLSEGLQIIDGLFSGPERRIGP